MNNKHSVGWKNAWQSTIVNLVDDWKHLHPQIGLWRATSQVIGSFAGRIYDELVLLKMDIDPNEPLPIRESKILMTVRRVQQGDVTKFPETIMPSRVSDFDRLMHSSDIGLVALSGDEIAAYAWIGIGPRKLLDCLGIHLTYQDAYFHTAYTFPRYRRRGLHTHLNGHRLYLAQERNCLQAYTLVAASNTASLRSCEAMGFRRVEHLTHLRLLNKELVRHELVVSQ